MLDNFQLAVIVKERGTTRLLSVPLHQDLQTNLAETWGQQYCDFVDDSHEIDFNAGYTPEDTECFRLAGFELPEWIAQETSQSVANLDDISQNEQVMDSIKGLAAFARDASGNELILFQNFSRSHVIRPGWSLFLSNDTYASVDRPGLTLDRKLSAIYVATEQKLLFRSFRTTNSFLPLSVFSEQATEQEIREVLNHDLLAPEDPDALAVNAPQWFRKRFAMLADSGVLDDYSAAEIVEHSEGYDVDIQTADDKIVFPAEKAAAKRLLQYLNEELFRGPITDTLYETNSKREADN